jgi:hypothetical protein
VVGCYGFAMETSHQMPSQEINRVCSLETMDARTPTATIKFNDHCMVKYGVPYMERTTQSCWYHKDCLEPSVAHPPAAHEYHTDQ